MAKKQVKSTGGVLTPGGTSEQRAMAEQVNAALGIDTCTGEVVQYLFAIWRRRGGKASGPIKTADSVRQSKQAKLEARQKRLAEQQARTERELAKVLKELEG